MAIKKVTVTDGFFTLRVDGNAIIIKRLDNEPIDELDHRADSLLTFYRKLMNSPEKVNVELVSILEAKDLFDGTFLDIRVYTCGTYHIKTTQIPKPKKPPFWAKYFV